MGGEMASGGARAPGLRLDDAAIFPDKARPQAPAVRQRVGSLVRSYSRELQRDAAAHAALSRGSSGNASSLSRESSAANLQGESGRCIMLIAGLPLVAGQSCATVPSEDALDQLARGDDMSMDNRPPSPRPRDETCQLVQHTRQLQVWANMATTPKSSTSGELAALSYRRSGPFRNAPQLFQRQQSADNTMSVEDDAEQSSSNSFGTT